MTALTPNDRFVSLSPSAGTTVLAYDFELMLPEGMTVIRIRAAVSAQLVLGVDFSFPGGIGDNTGGTLTLAVASLAGDVYLLVGAQPEQRLSDFVGSQKFNSAKMNADLDALTIVAQEHRRDIGRSWKSAYGTAGGQITAGSAAELLSFDAAGNIVGAGITVAALLASVSSYATAAAASATAAAGSATSATNSANAAAGSATAAGGSATAAANSAAAAAATLSAAGLPAVTVANSYLKRNAGNTAYDPIFIPADDVLYVEARTGGNVLSVFTVLKERIRASSFGCSASNPASVNRAAINNAINAAGANGALVMLPAGIINVDGTALALTGHVDVEGQGDGTIINTNHATADMFVVNAQWVTLRQLYMAASVTRTGGNFVNLQSSANRFEMRDFHMEGAYQGIQIGVTASARIRAGKILSTVAGGIGIRVNTGLDLKLRDILMDGNPAAQPFAGIYVPNCGDLTLEDSQIIHQGQDLYLNPGAGQNITSFWANNTFFDTSNRALYMQAVGAGAVIGRCIFDQCWFSSSTNEGIRMETGSGGVIDGTDFINPHVFLNGGAGISMRDSGVTNTRIIQPNIVKNTGDGILANTGVTKFSVIGGKIGDGAGFGAGSGNGGWGINLAGSNDGYVILGVDLRANTSGALNGHVQSATRKARFNLGTGSNDAGELGTTTNDNAIAGNIGEYMESVVLSGAAVALVTATGKTITSLALTPGDWDIDGTVVIFPANTTNVTQMAGSISSVTNNVDTTPGRYAEPPFPSAGFAYNGAKAPHINTPTQRVSINANTTYYLVALASFTVSTVSAFGTIRARRVR